jgi:hypothetical protein
MMDTNRWLLEKLFPELVGKEKNASWPWTVGLYDVHFTDFDPANNLEQALDCLDVWFRREWYHEYNIFGMRIDGHTHIVCDLSSTPEFWQGKGTTIAAAITAALLVATGYQTA